MVSEYGAALGVRPLAYSRGASKSKITGAENPNQTDNRGGPDQLDRKPGFLSDISTGF